MSAVGHHDGRGYKRELQALKLNADARQVSCAVTAIAPHSKPKKRQIADFSLAPRLASLRRVRRDRRSGAEPTAASYILCSRVARRGCGDCGARKRARFLTPEVSSLAPNLCSACRQVLAKPPAASTRFQRSIRPARRIECLWQPLVSTDRR